MHSGWCGPEVFSGIIYRPPQHRWKLQRASESRNGIRYIVYVQLNMRET